MPDPLIIAIASGKGGVGKTMLSVACAYELSIGGPTLLLDLDFFNRGLAGLFPKGEVIGEVARPDFLGAADSGEKEPWQIIRIARDLYHVTFPDLDPTELSGLEITNAFAIRESLARFIEEVRMKCDALRVVLDCHGGPDHTSFAAAMLARHTLLISEPDRITFHGTLNFLRQLDRSLGDTPKSTDEPTADVRLVFNKVVTAFRAPFLRRLYDEYLREEFGGFDLLAIFPMELPLTKAFEETPLLSRAYPYSLLARKMRVLLLDLLGDRARDYLALSAPTLPCWVRKYRRRTLGRVPWWLDDSAILQIVVVIVAFLVIGTEWDKRLPDPPAAPLSRLALIATVNKYPSFKPQSGSFSDRFIRAEFAGGTWSQDPFVAWSAGFFPEYNERNRLDYYDYAREQDLLRASTQIQKEIFGPEFRTGKNQELLFASSLIYGRIDLRAGQMYFLDHLASFAKPSSYKQEWAREIALLHSNYWWKRLLRRIHLFSDKWHFHMMIIGLAWFGTAFLLDASRRLDAVFTRRMRIGLHAGFYAGLIPLAIGIAIWVLSLFLINIGMREKAPDERYAPAEMAAWLVIPAYLFIIGHQFYRCWRITYERAFDLASLVEKGRGEMRKVGVPAMLTTRVWSESIFRMIFVLVLIAALVLFSLTVVHHLLF